ncbi:MAG: hypothetical protein ACTSUI_01600, partial [Promethearchaeota archaeon]
TPENNSDDEDSESIEMEKEKGLSFGDKIKLFIFSSIFRMRNFEISIISNLPLAKKIMIKNQNLVQKQSLVGSLENIEFVNNSITDIESKIKLTGKDIDDDLKKFNKLYKSEEYLNAACSTTVLLKKIRKYGLKEKTPSTKSLKKQISKSLKLERRLSKFGEGSPTFESDQLKRYYYNLSRLNTKIQAQTDLYNAKLVNRIINTIKLYKTAIESQKISIEALGFADKVKFWFQNKIEYIKILSYNLKLGAYSKLGGNYKNLMKAWTNLQNGQELCNKYPLLIFKDQKLKFLKLKEDTQAFIDELNKETQNQLDETQEKMNNFEFSQATDQLYEFKIKLFSYNMVALASQIEDQEKICNLNNIIYEDILHIEEIYQNKDFLNSQKTLKTLQNRVNTEIPSELVLAPILDSIEKLDIKINESRENGEKILRDELVAINKELLEKLNFNELRPILYEKKKIGENQEYSEFLNEYNEFMVEFEENNAIFIEFDRLKNLFEQEIYGDVTNSLPKLLEKVDSTQILCYSKLSKNIKEFESKVVEKVNSEKKMFEEKIERAESIIEEEFDLESAQTIFDEMKKRIESTHLVQFNDLLHPLSQKIDLNLEGRGELQQIQMLFSEGDLKASEHQCRSLLKEIDKTLKKTPKIYSSTLRSSLDMLQQQIKSALADGVDKLQNEYSQIDGLLKDSLDLIPIQQLLANYKIRAIRLGLEDLKGEIESKLLTVIDNTAILAEKNALAGKYNNLEDFSQTLDSINEFSERFSDLKNLYPQVKKDINKFLKKVVSESKDRDLRMQNALKQIVETEINELDFVKAQNSLKDLSEKCSNLGVTSINSEIQGYLGICASHLGLLQNIEDIVAVAEDGKVIQAQKMIAGIITSISQYDGVIIQPMRDRVEEVKNLIQNSINTQIKEIKKALKRIVKVVEEKKAKTVYDELLELKDKAVYLKEEDLLDEITGLITLSELQFTPEEILKKSGAKKSVSEKAETVINTFSMEEISAQTPASEQTAIFKITKNDLALFDENESVPQFNSMEEKRDFKRKRSMLKRTRRIKPPKVEENLNNSLRSSVTRRRLQIYNRQVNARTEKKMIHKCPECGAEQIDKNPLYCYLCGHLFN